jgi:hypothetical protein
MARHRFLLALALLGVAARAGAQSTNIAILMAEDRRAATAADLAVIRAGLRSRDGQTQRTRCARSGASSGRPSFPTSFPR